MLSLDEGTPAAEAGKELRPFIGILAEESDRRTAAYLQNGCNAFNAKKPNFKPMGFWREQDVLEYIRKYAVPYAREIYGEIVEKTTAA